MTDDVIVRVQYTKDQKSCVQSVFNIINLMAIKRSIVFFKSAVYIYYIYVVLHDTVL